MSCPWEQDMLRYGGYNLGFAAARRSDEAIRMLRWWEDRCLTRGFHSPPDGFFVDQKFMDLASMFFDGVKPVRHPGLNVAYWNLHERPMHQQGQRYMVGDVPLIFFHFSGFVFQPNAEQRDWITKYPCDLTLQDRPELRPILEDYRQRLVDNGHATRKSISYTFARFDNGCEIPKLVRRLVGTETLQAPSATLFKSDGDFYRRIKRLRLLPKFPAKASTASASVKARQATQTRTAERLMFALLRAIGITRYERILRLLERLSSPFNQSFLVHDAERKSAP
jgi:hypothetical protein